MRSTGCRMMFVFLLFVGIGVVEGQAKTSKLVVPNNSFEQETDGFASGWAVGIGGGAKATVTLDAAEAHSGRCSVRIHNESPFKAFTYACFSSRPITVEPDTTYIVRFYAKGQNARKCYVAAVFGDAGDQRQTLPAGDFDWRKVVFSFTTPATCKSVKILFGCDDVTDALWIDDVSLERASTSLANLTERTCPKPFDGFFPRTPGPIAKHLLVCDLSNSTFGPTGCDLDFTVACLQGIVNRSRPRIYIIHKTNPKYYDAAWLEYMKAKSYTGREEIVGPKELIRRFRDEISGVILYDTELPGSRLAALMLSGLKNAIPVCVATLKAIEDLHLPVVMDLRGRWRRNVEAYEFIYRRYWDKMNHHVLCWKYPLATYHGVDDYLVAFNVFCFWVSDYDDKEKGADPPAERAFLNKLLASTPGNVPVMGWPNYADHVGIAEYTAMRWISEYGKFFPGTEYCTNLTVHSAIRPEEHVFRQKFRNHPSGVKLQNDKVYVSVNILDSGDSIWYHQFHQRKIWADPVRGTVPIGFSMNPQIHDLLPLVAQWYYEHATPREEFFSFIYMNTQVYAERFRRKDRERIRDEFARLTAEYCRKMDMDGIELYNGGWSARTPPRPGTFARFVKAMPNLNYILADLGRHDCITPGNADSLLGNTAVFHTLTRFQVWSSSAEVARKDMAAANRWLIGEIKKNTPKERPGFMSVMAVSWYFYPTWLKDLQEKLPAEYVMVAPHDLARLFREHQSRKARQ